MEKEKNFLNLYDYYIDEEAREIIDKLASLPTFNWVEDFKEGTVYLIPTANEKPVKVVFEGELLTPEEHLIKWSDILNRIKIGD